jgi:hypothetical protein
MPFITLTNTADAFRGNKITINTDAIISVYTHVHTNEDGSIESKTMLYCPPHGNWEVAESLENVTETLNTLTKPAK